MTSVTSTSLMGSAGRYLSKQLSSAFRQSPELAAVSAVDVADADELGPREVRSLQKALRKTEKAIKKEQLAQLRPKYHRSMKVDPLSTSSYRMSAKRAIQNVLKESNYAV